MLEMQPFEPAGRLGQFMRLLDDCDADMIGQAIDALIARLDARDGDPDLEDDDLAAVIMLAPGVDYDPAEDDSKPDGLPGDPVDAEDGDDAEQDTADAGDVAWVEWDGRSRAQLRAFAEPVGRLCEDDEDDDPAEDDDSDRCAAGDDMMIAGAAIMRDFYREGPRDNEDSEPDTDREQGSWSEDIYQPSFMRCDHYEPDEVPADVVNQAPVVAANDA